MKRFLTSRLQTRESQRRRPRQGEGHPSREDRQPPHGAPPLLPPSSNSGMGCPLSLMCQLRSHPARLTPVPRQLPLFTSITRHCPPSSQTSPCSTPNQAVISMPPQLHTAPGSGPPMGLGTGLLLRRPAPTFLPRPQHPRPPQQSTSAAPESCRRM